MAILKPEGRLISWLRRKVYRVVGIRSGPAMLAVRGEWLFIDWDGKVYRLKPSFSYQGSPLTITLEHY